MNALLKVSFVGLILGTSIVNAEQYGPYNQKFTYNQQFSSGNWYSSPLGQGAAMAGVAIVSGLVNAMSRPDPVVVVSPNQHYQQQQPQTQVYPQQQQQTQSYPYRNPGDSYNPQQQVTSRDNCSMQTLFDRSGNPRYVRVCE